ncbi:MAG: fatty acid desaturase [Paracoccaceae bacterium]
MQAQDWSRVLSKYREPIALRSVFELAVSVLPFLMIFGLACWALTISVWIALGLSVLNGLFLVRIFLIQHDCGHGSFFKNREVGDWVGRVLSVLTVTPYDVWRKSHATHHATSGNLDRRGTGDIPTLTVREYRQRSWAGRTAYWLCRNPLVLFGLGPAYIFLLLHRVPFGLMRAGWRYWLSVMLTNLAIATVVGAVFWFGGWQAVAFVYLPTVLMGASIGMWLFFVQHQFEDTSWDNEQDWQVQDAAFHGSSHYILPEPLRWFSANIGAHHIHHLASRIPYYRLPEVLRDHDALNQCHRLTLRESFKCVKLHLWDEENRRLVSFAEARLQPV